MVVFVSIPKAPLGWQGAYQGLPTTGDMDIDVVDIDHVAIRVTDLDRALWFYHEVLGMSVRDQDRYAAGAVPYVAVVAGGRHIHLVPTDDDIDVAGEHLCLLVRSETTDANADVDALLDTLRAHDITVESAEPRKRYGAYGRSWAAYVRDPDGRRVELKVQ